MPSSATPITPFPTQPVEPDCVLNVGQVQLQITG